jgi:phospholipid-binding lipoprotein MlaA
MGLRGSNTVIKKNDMRWQALFIVVLAVTTAGCAVSEKTPSSNYVSEALANRQHALTFSNNATLALDNPAGLPAGDDFDLLEEELVEQMVEVEDPLEPLNRIMYHMNDTLYFWVLKPVAQAYKGVTPEPVRIGIRNFFQNLATPVRFVNCLLQGKGAAAGTELHRFAVNTTAGVLGFGDPALDELGLQPAKEDLGQTLAIYGLDNGFYIVWPFFGPSTVRDSLGMVGDQFLNPTRYVEPMEASIGISAVKGTNASSFYIGKYEALKSEALEPYVVMRESYIQYRNKQIQE